ncbi:hypothetical protein PLESTB_000701700 [Pleodorina starrii]|uniref:Uncharacterized protein n=1 Tax=Pleodorina starrii TaxID=330485 RepID=A0A9W6F2B8_9CHLO|nr:hypothetical protein PLESTM_001215000 [Pleodorina starrii]GLC53041.1 hypothetical protein PLESTB_000701700 [Pleodorina starrii]GLC75011.1 hypothetical protein PLESTF_001583400 [Pleodorina starrii]
MQRKHPASISRQADALHRDPNSMAEPQLLSQAEQSPPQTAQTSNPTQTLPPSLPAEVIRHHLIPALPLSVLRVFRRASRAARDDVARYAVRSIRRAPATHPLPPDLGARFPALTRLDLSGDTQLEGGLALFRALQSASRLTSLSLAGCSALPASFVSRQLVEACPRLQHLALSCSCSAGPDTEAAVMAALGAAPLAASLTSLELHCGGAFQPELHHLAAAELGRRLTALRVYASRTLDDAALAELPRVAPGLAVLVLGEQQSRRGRHVRGEGLGALAGLGALRALSLACADPDGRRMAAALATLTQLQELDLSRCEPRLLEALAPLRALVCGGGGGGGGALRRLCLPTAYTTQQLERGLPAVFGGGDGGDRRRDGEAGVAVAAAAAAELQSLRLHASAPLPEGVVRAMSRLCGLRELSLSHCGPAGSGAAVVAAAAAVTGLTSFHLVQEYGSAADGGFGLEDDDGGGGITSSAAAGAETADRADPRVGDVATWYDGLLAWRSLRRLELTGTDGLDDRHLYEIGRSLGALSYFSLSRNARATGAGFASWPAGCSQLTALTLYDCARVGDAAVEHVAALPLRTLTLAHLPEVGAAGVLRLAGNCTTLRSLTLERLAGAPGSALAALWRLPLLEALCLRMCSVNNQTLEMAFLSPEQQTEAPGPVSSSSSAVAENPRGTAMAAVSGSGNPAAQEALELDRAAPPDGGAAGDDGAAPPPPPPPAQSLTWLELQGSLVSTMGLWPLRHAAGLTHLDLSYCLSVGDQVADLLLHGGGRKAAAAAGGSTAGEAEPPEAAPPQPAGSAAGGACSTPGGGLGLSGGGGGGGGVRLLLPCLVHVDLRGCMVAESTLERLRMAGLAVDPGTGTWR